MLDVLAVAALSKEVRCCGWGGGICGGLTTSTDASEGKSERYSISDGWTLDICSSTFCGSGVPSSLGVDAAVCGVVLLAGGAGVVAAVEVGENGTSPRGFVGKRVRLRERNLLVTTRVWPPNIASSS